MLESRLSRQELLLLLPVVALVAAGLSLVVGNRPYQDMLGTYSTSLTARSDAQIQNIRTAASKLDGAVVMPGERFSFNAVVGPRTSERGYREANAFMEGSLTRSLGGGICQLSSTLYAAIQETTLPVPERVAHGRATQSVPPGRDAAVWYGKADLSFVNTFSRPLRLATRVSPVAVTVELWGSAEPGQRASLRFAYAYGRDVRDRHVRVYRRVEGKNTQLSDDVYRVD